MNFKSKVCHSSSYHPEAMEWNSEIESAKNIDELKKFSSRLGKQCSDFEVLDCKIASGLKNIFHSDFKMRTCGEELMAPKESIFLKGRQIAFFDLRYLQD